MNKQHLSRQGTACFTPPLKPNISVTRGNLSGQGMVTVPLIVNNTGDVDARNVTITSITPTSPATYAGPTLPLTIGTITPGTNGSTSIQLNVSVMAPGSVARFQINGSYQDSDGNDHQFSSPGDFRVP